MSSDQIILSIQKVKTLKQELREVKGDMKDFEKVVRDDYDDLKQAFKDMKEQMKTIEEEWKKGLLEDKEYLDLREMKMKKEEEIAEHTKKLFEQLEKLPRQPVSFQVDTEAGPVNIQILPEMRLYMNGKEEKKRS